MLPGPSPSTKTGHCTSPRCGRPSPPAPACGCGPASPPESDKSSKRQWTTTANRFPFGPPAWQITFDATTPVELLHDVHTELLDLYLDRHSDRDWLYEDETAPYEACVPLFARC
ncbi:DUF317 domain-containing protein [Streptomyces sp. NPDC056638]|uniref:DUF317 domain-containing protein n=1 Tax=Streptomyces sp. NPDC056638 TaxID=3345887 RepID=UPI0036B520BA